MSGIAQNEVILIIVVGTIGMALVGTVVAFASIHQRRVTQEQERLKLKDREHSEKMIQAQLESQEAERKRIAADLHDSLGSLLWGAKLNSAVIERYVQFNEGARASYAELRSTLDQSLDTVKRIVWELAPEGFYLAGLSQSILSLCERINGKGITVEFYEHGTSQFLNDAKALLIFRIVQELISNCVKHASASNMTVILHWLDNHLWVTVRDNGIGFPEPQTYIGLGWWSIRQRTRQLRASISIGQAANIKGASVFIEIPLPL